MRWWVEPWDGHGPYADHTIAVTVDLKRRAGHGSQEKNDQVAVDVENVVGGSNDT